MQAVPVPVAKVLPYNNGLKRVCFPVKRLEICDCIEFAPIFLTAFVKILRFCSLFFRTQPLPLPSFHKTNGCGDLWLKLKQARFSTGHLVNVKKLF